MIYKAIAEWQKSILTDILRISDLHVLLIFFNLISYYFLYDKIYGSKVQWDSDVHD